MNDEKGESFYNRSLERALYILNAFDGDREALTLAQLSTILDLPKATVLRLCSTLVKFGFLRQDPESKQYSLGLRLFELGSRVFRSFSLRKVASHHLAQLQKKLGNTVFLGVVDNDDLLYIDKREDTRNPISFTSEIGRRRPATWGMVGPAILAFQPESEVDRLLDAKPLVPTTRKSFTTKEEFMAWLRRIRELGYAFDQEKALDGISGVAAPIRDASGKVIAALGSAFISSSVDAKGLKKIIKEIVLTAHTLSRELGYATGRNDLH